MTLYTDLEEFIQAHRACGTATWWAERWVLPQDADKDFVTEALQAARRHPKETA